VQVNGKNTMATMTIFAHALIFEQETLKLPAKAGVLTLQKWDNNRKPLGAESHNPDNRRSPGRLP
jgi:hypothetical protein